jgi:hypothetical protein
MKLNFYPHLRRFIQDIEIEYGPTAGTEIRIILPSKMFNYAWRDVAEYGTMTSIDDIKPKTITCHIGNYTCIIEREDKPEPTRVADYLVFKEYYYIDCYIKQTHPIGQQPEGAVLIPGSERDD